MKNKIIKEYVKVMLEQEIGNLNYPTNPEIIVYLDSDGVLANFNESIDSNPKNKKLQQVYDNLINQNPEFSGLTDQQIKKRLAGPQSDPNLKAIKKAWQELKQNIYIVAGQQGFFLNLSPMPGALELIQGATNITGKKPSILTAPIENNKEICKKEKQQWFEINFPGMYSNFHCTKDKEKYARPGSILIDDREDYIDKFTNAGGIGILYKGNVSDALNKLQEIINQIKQK